MEALKPLVLKDLAGPMLTVNVTSTTGPVIGRVYLQQDSVSLPAENKSWCAVLVVISGQNAPSTFTAELPGVVDGSTAGGMPSYVTTAYTMLPFNSYSVPISNGTGTRTVRTKLTLPHSGAV